LRGARVRVGRGIRTCPEGDQAGSCQPGARHQLEHSSPVQQPGEIVVEATIMVLEIGFLVAYPHHDQLFARSEFAWLMTIFAPG
jgi:hypothetical protein